jgi:hypothetical protein
MLFASHPFLLSARKLGLKKELAAMSQDYNPLLWQWPDAEFALLTIHDTYSQAELSKVIEEKSKDPEIRGMAVTLTREH